MPSVLSDTMKLLGSRPFLQHQAQSLPLFVSSLAYNAKKQDLRNTAEYLLLNNITEDANVISSHIVYKI